MLFAFVNNFLWKRRHFIKFFLSSLVPIRQLLLIRAHFLQMLWGSVRLSRHDSVPLTIFSVPEFVLLQSEK
ncbi:expressed protein [Echinococcus multilocularis]|uniref:Expressed protein n=1 Tax=Echinococcus multilocularis TaxID=6211 RepID=A0A068YBG7_ECHMU|nr:expressed protein [Echinococcus multilocularis]